MSKAYEEICQALIDAQDQLPHRTATISLRPQSGARPAAKPNQPRGHLATLRDNTGSFNKNINHADSREINSEWFWDDP